MNEAESLPDPTARPLSATEHVVARIWQRMFGVSDLGAADHFFALGGDSMTAVQMIGEVEGQFDMVLPSFLVFEAPTIASLAQRIDRARALQDAQSQRGFIFPLASSGLGAPMFLNGLDLPLRGRRVWSVPCPAFAIANGAAGSGFVHARSLRALATFYLEKIRTMQRRGPFRLGGFSLGAAISYEIAQQLNEGGEAVELLFLLDPVLPANRHALPAERPHRPRESFDMMFPGERWDVFRLAAERLLGTFAPRPYSSRVLAVFSRDRAETEAWAPLLQHGARRVVLDANQQQLFETPAIDDWMRELAHALENTSRSMGFAPQVEPDRR